MDTEFFFSSLLPSAAYNLFKASGEPPTGEFPSRMTPSMSNAMPNEGLLVLDQLLNPKIMKLRIQSERKEKYKHELS